MPAALELESLARSVTDTLNQLESEIESQISAAVSLRNECAAVDATDTTTSGENWTGLLSQAAKVEAEMQTSSLKHSIDLKSQEVECKIEAIRVLEECEAKLKAFAAQINEAKGAVSSVSDFQDHSHQLIERVNKTTAQAMQSLEENALYGWNKGKNYLEDELNDEVDRAIGDLNFYLKSETSLLESYITHQLLSTHAQLSALNGDIHNAELKGPEKMAADRASVALLTHNQGVQQGYDQLMVEADLSAQQIVGLSMQFQQFTSYFKTLAPSSVKFTQCNEERSRAKLKFMRLYADVDSHIQAFSSNASGYELSCKASLFDLVELGEGLKDAEFKRNTNAAREDLNKKLRGLEDKGENLKAQLRGVERTLDREVKISLTVEA